jgi:hypothetical protein
MEDTLEAAIQRLFSGSLPSLRMMEGGGAPATGKMPKETAAGALELLKKAREALRKDDWAAYGKYLKEMEQTLQNMAK